MNYCRKMDNLVFGVALRLKRFGLVGKSTGLGRNFTATTYTAFSMSPHPVNISAVIITFNEADNIGACIDSLSGVADEIIVVDSYSTDATSEICHQKGVHFVQHKFEGHIEQKNYALTLAKYPYILSLDADEVLSELLRKSILEVKQHPDYDGYYLNRLNNYCGRWIRYGNWYPDRKLRLWNKTKGQWGGVNPHDRLIMDLGATTSGLNGDLMHYTIKSVAQHLGQINKFSSIRAEQLFKQGKKPTLYFLWCKPMVSFIWSYFVKLGFLDGYFGFIISFNSAYAVFLRYAKLKELWNQPR